MNKPVYTKPELISHQAIAFETKISGPGGGHPGHGGPGGPGGGPGGGHGGGPGGGHGGFWDWLGNWFP